MQSLIYEIAQGARALVRNRSFTALALLTLALGAGTNGAMFAVLDCIVLRPLDYPDSDQLVTVWPVDAKGDESLASRAQAKEFAARNRSLDGVAAFTINTEHLAGVDHSRPVAEVLATANFFTLLGVQPLLGRTFLPIEDKSDATPIAVISYNLWLSEMASDPAAIGKTLTVGGTRYSIVGIMGPKFETPIYKGTELWVPLNLDGTYKDLPMKDSLTMLAKLKPGVELGAAQSQMEDAFQDETAGRSDPGRQVKAELIPLKKMVVSDHYQDVLLKLYLGMCLALFVGCADLVNLFLAHTGGRRSEMALRISLGATRLRIIGQIAVESALLGLAGGVAAIPLCRWLVGLFVAAAPKNTPRIDEVVVDWRVLLFAVAVSTVCSLACGLMTGRRAFVPKRGESLGEMLRGGDSTTSPEVSRQRFANRILTFEIALSLAVMTAAGVVLRTFLNLRPSDVGFDPSGKLALSIRLPERGYITSAEKVALLDRLRERIQAVSAVTAVAVAESVPMSDRAIWPVQARPLGRPEWTGEETRAIYGRVVSDNYFRVMGVKRLAGRSLGRSDNEDSVPVVVVNQTMARYLWPGEDAVGKKVAMPKVDAKLTWEVVGVCADERMFGHDNISRPQVYIPYARHPLRSLVLIVQSRQNPEKLAQVVRGQILSVDKGVDIDLTRTVEQFVSESVASQRFFSMLTWLFALLALLLATVGIYAVTWHSVARRTREIGIRMALGARPKDMARLLLGQGLRNAALGIGVGLLASLAATRLVSSLLYDVKPSDPLTFGLSAAVVLISSAVAIYIPAHRATRVDPMVALRYE